MPEQHKRAIDARFAGPAGTLQRKPPWLRVSRPFDGRPVRELLKPGKLVDVVKNVLENDVPVDVPDPSFEPDGNTSISELQTLWHRERKLLWALFETVNAKNVDTVMFSHPATGPLTPLQTLELSLIHLDNHHRRINDHLQGV